MRLDTFLCTVALAATLLVQPAAADDITGAQKILCTAVEATECYAEGSCTPGAPEDWNMPRFVEIDLEEKQLRTTEASGEVRSSPMKHIESEDDRVFIQGVEASRAFSIVLDQDSGTASIAIALERHVVAVFAYCTPLQSAD